MPEQSDAKAFGEFFHTLMLEGEEVADSRFIVKPDGIDRRTKDGKLKWDEFCSEAGARAIITKEESDLAWRMCDAIRGKSTARKLFERGKPEVVFRKQMASFPISCRCDWFDDVPDEHDRPTVVDLKTINRLGEFERQFLKYSYYRQASSYGLIVNSTLSRDGALPRFIFVVVEKEEPFDVSIREPDQISLDIGRREVMRDLAKLKACYDSGVFPGEPDEVRPVSLPDWMLTKAI